MIMTTTSPSTAVASIDDAVHRMTALLDEMMTAGRETTTRRLEQAMTAVKEQVETVAHQMVHYFDDLGGVHKANMEALTAAGTAAIKGAGTMNQAAADLLRQDLDRKLDFGRALIAARSLREAVELQTDYLKTTLDVRIAGATALSDLSLRVANDTLAPLGARLNAAAEALAKPAGT